MIKNPLCENAAGCGKWEPPMIANPEYKGKWRAPLIDNPNYQGKWSPKKIQNPDFFEDNDPFSRMTTIVCYMLLISLDFLLCQRSHINALQTIYL